MWHKSNLQSQKSSTVCVRNPILWHDKIGIYQNRIFRFELNSICLSGQNRCLKLAFKTSPISNISLNLCAGLSNMSSFKHLMWLWFDLRKSHQGGHPEVGLPDIYPFCTSHIFLALCNHQLDHSYVMLSSFGYTPPTPPPPCPHHRTPKSFEEIRYYMYA